MVVLGAGGVFEQVGMFSRETLDILRDGAMTIWYGQQSVPRPLRMDGRVGTWLRGQDGFYSTQYSRYSYCVIYRSDTVYIQYIGSIPILTSLDKPDR